VYVTLETNYTTTSTNKINKETAESAESSLNLRCTVEKGREENSHSVYKKPWYS
jgi:hypothetical protein